MQPINLLSCFSRPHLDLDNLRNRIKENSAVLDDLKTNSGFQNVLTMMRKKNIPNELLFRFLTAKASLEECLGNELGRIDFLIRTYEGLEFGESGSHFLRESIANVLLTIFKPGYFEPIEKTDAKINTLLKAIENEDSAEKIEVDLANGQAVKLLFDLIRSEDRLGVSNLNKDNLNLLSRIEENRSLIDGLKRNDRFQNVLILMQSKISDELLLQFLIGELSLEQCLDDDWMINLLANSYDGFDAYYGEGDKEDDEPEAIFLSESLASTLLGIFKPGDFESSEETDPKIHTLIKALRNSSSKKLNFQQADLTQAYLHGAILPEVNLAGANLTQADLTNAYLSRANLSRANLTDTDLANADLGGADLTGADLTRANLTEADLNWADLRKAFSPEANLAGANLTMATLSEANLARADLSGADLGQAKLLKADLTGANLAGADLSTACLAGANLTRANLTGATLWVANLAGANLRLADLRNAKLEKINLTGAYLIGAKSTDPIILAMIEKQEQAFEKYKLLSPLTTEFTLQDARFPQELMAKIGRDLM